MKTISAFIVDDNEIDLRAVEMNLTLYCPEVNVIGKFLHSAQALEAAKTVMPLVVFLDIDMFEMSGLELAKEFNALKIVTVFISAHSQFALPALKISAADFLVKPINPLELTTCVRKIKSLILSKAEKFQSMLDGVDHLVNASATKFIALPTISEITITDVNNILYCEGIGNYTKVHIREEADIVLSKTISLIENQLNPDIFVRVHSKYLVNTCFITKMIRDGKAGTLIMEDGTPIPISKSRKKHFLSKISCL